jgi:signal transduction histidine kinase
MIAIEASGGQPHRQALPSSLGRDLLLAMLEHSPAGVAIVDGHNLRLRYTNQQFQRLLLDDLQPDSQGVAVNLYDLYDLFPGGGGRQITALVRQVSWSGRTATREALRLEGLARGPVYWDITAARLEEYVDGAPAIMLQVVDVTSPVVAKAEHERLDTLKDDFLAATAHELRTPVTALLGYTNLLVRRAEQGDWHDRDLHALRILELQVQRLTQLVNGLIDVSHVQTGAIELTRQRIDLLALVEQAAAALQTDGLGHSIVVEGHDRPVEVLGDPRRLDQIISHLISNALKYSPWGGTIQVAVWKDSAAHVSVADEGIGVPEQALPLLFDRFYRATNVDSERISGLGIGLYLVKELVAAHDGYINVRSAPGGGTTFEVTLPLYQRSENGTDY